MFALDLLRLIPQRFKQQALEALVDFVSAQAKKFAGDDIAARIKKLRSDAAFQEAFEAGLQRAAQRFIEEYEIEDEDLVAAIAADEDFFQNKQIQSALLTILKKPGTYLAEERATLTQSFTTVLPQRKNRERVDQAVTYLLKCLAEELWQLPELRPIYSLQFQRMTAEATRQQVELQKAQLQALTGLNVGVREALLQLTDAIAERKLLPSGDAPALPEPKRVYHNLPQPDYGTFIGRDEELKQVHSLLSSRSRHFLVTIDGIGGIGKSALALEVAHRYLRDYDRLPPGERFEAIVWASAKSAVLTADGIVPRQQITRTLEDICTTISVTLEREDITRARSEEQDELVRRALVSQRTLLIVDNLETVDDERVNTFLRELPTPTKAIVTTRHRIDVAYPVRLMGMPKEDGLVLIAQECAKKDVVLTKAETERLYDRTGGVPLAIVWSMAQMGYGYSAETVLRRLGQPTGDIARFCFEGSIECIRGADAHKLLMALSLFAVDASREALGYVAGLDKDMLSRDQGLVILEQLSLISKHGDRFEMLPLTKGYASSELIASVARSDLINLWIDYFVKLSGEYSDRYWNWTNYDWLLAEGDNVLALADWAIANGRENTALQLHYAIMRYLDIKGRWVELTHYGELLYKVAQSLYERQVMAWICTHWMGYFYAEQGFFARAEEITKEGITLYHEIGDEKGVCLAIANLGRVLRKSGQLEASKQKAKEALELAQEIDYYDGFAVAYDQLGKVARDLEMWAVAKENLDKARVLCEGDEANMDMSLLMNILGNLGWVEFNLRNYEHGRDLCERSLDFFKRMGGKGYTTSLQCRLAAIENALGNDTKARQYAQEALYWADKLQMPGEARLARSLIAQMTESAEQPRTAG